MTADLRRMRIEYETEGLSLGDLAADPIEQFQGWLTTAVDGGVPEANAMVVSTVDPEGQPWSRLVLLKAVGPAGLDFYTNFESSKSHHLEHNPKVALTFGWVQIRRQVNIAGIAQRVPDREADAYWASRPRGSQLGALASAQSQPLASRQELLDRYQRLEDELSGNIARPAHWGGWRVRPHTVELWQGRLNRLHDRFRYTRSGDSWEISRLAP